MSNKNSKPSFSLQALDPRELAAVHGGEGAIPTQAALDGLWAPSTAFERGAYAGLMSSIGDMRSGTYSYQSSSQTVWTR